MKRGYRCSLRLSLALLCALAWMLPAARAQEANAPAFPKYKVMGVVYAPPGSNLDHAV
jgi:hypothetical protein